MSLSNLGLDAFESIAENGTIVIAAKKLGVTQTALTQRIKLLEAELESPLFVRSRTGMKLTEEGRTLFEYCVRRKQNEKLALQKIKGLSIVEPFRIRIAGPTLQLQERFFGILEVLKQSYPHLYFDFHIDDSNDPVQGLREHRFDLALSSTTPPTAIQFKKLSPSELVLVGPSAWKRRELKEILQNESIIDFNQNDPYTLEFLKKFHLLPKVLKERHFINNTFQMMELVEKGLGYAVFDIRSIQNKVKEKKLVDLAPKHHLASQWHLCWNDFGEQMNPAISKIISIIE